ncbi:hypothetical protein V6N13_135256 [Hibiscus sabdariffa]
MKEWRKTGGISVTGSVDGPSDSDAASSKEDVVEVLLVLLLEILVERLVRCYHGRSVRGGGMTRERSSGLSIKDFPFSKNHC